MQGRVPQEQVAFTFEAYNILKTLYITNLLLQRKSKLYLVQNLKLPVIHLKHKTT